MTAHSHATASLTAAVRALLLGEVVPEEFDPRGVPAMERLRIALQSKSSRSPIDLAVLIRYALETLQDRENTTSMAVRQGAGWPDQPLWRQVSIDAHRETSQFRLRVRPWQPGWLRGSAGQPVTRTVVHGRVLNKYAAAEGLAGDPFLYRLGHNTFASPGQRTALRAALTMPPGATLLISLPTGEGKSTVFRAIDEFGFDSNERAETVVVVVPTVTLALDHEQHFRRNPQERLAYIGGHERAESNREIRDRIAAGTQRLCFAAPEAVCGPLRDSLIRAAQQGTLKALVVDEAHLVDSWGTGFRYDFQILSALYSELQSAAGAMFRTVLLSATLTCEGVALLRQLFSHPERVWGMVWAARVRKEIEFWVAPPCAEADRHNRVEEALAHLPRPCILYVTKVADADYWSVRLREFGYRSLATVHGNTPNSERERVLRHWGAGDLDLVVGTSAFGLGIDYGKVRAVVHACIPESLDRFYQEVGRSGRDGNPSLSLLLPAHADLDVAQGLNMERLIRVETGMRRWRAMWDRRVTRSPEDNLRRIYQILVDTPPGRFGAEGDMDGKRNRDWNVHTINLMARARLIEILGMASQTSGSSVGAGPDAFLVRPLAGDHLDQARWEQDFERIRSEIHEAGFDSLGLMERFLGGLECAAKLFAELYTFQQNSRHFTATPLCTGCACCREMGGYEFPAAVPPEADYPWSAGNLPASIVDLLDRRLLLVKYSPDLVDRPLRHQELLRDGLVPLCHLGLRKLVQLGRPILARTELQKERFRKPLFVADEADPAAMTRLPPGPQIIIVGQGSELPPWYLQERRPGDEMILLFPENLRHPNRPGSRLIDAPPSLPIALSTLYQRLKQ